MVKVGTSTLTYATGKTNLRRMMQLCAVLSDLHNAGMDVVLVTSGAIGVGVGRLGLEKKPQDIPGRQAAACVGQCELMYIYDKLFDEYHHTVAQILITGDDLENERYRDNFSNTIYKLLDYGALPIINENDTVATDEIVIGDNDTLAALVSRFINADLLILLSDIDGLYTADPRKDANAELIEMVDEINDDILSLASGKGSELGTGGMITKLNAAKICMDCGCTMVIANGSVPENLYDIIDGKKVGTKFCPKK